MKNLKKQLHEKSSADTNQAENKTRTQSLEQGTVSNEKKESNSSKEDSATVVKELPYTPGVVLKFHCQSHGVTKKELRVKKIKQLHLFIFCFHVTVYAVCNFSLSFKGATSSFLYFENIG